MFEALLDHVLEYFELSYSFVFVVPSVVLHVSLTVNDVDQLLGPQPLIKHPLAPNFKTEDFSNHLDACGFAGPGGS